MEKFTVEVLSSIFEHLNLDQLLVARNVCFNWSFVIDDMIKSKPLWLKKFDENSHFYRFFGTTQVYENHQFNITNSLLSFRLCDEIHPKITKLVTYSPQVLINLKLDNLLVLEIKNNKPISRFNGSDILDIILNHNHAEQNQPLTLKFKKLKTFAFKARTDFNFVLDAEQLINLEVICDLQLIHIMHPKSVKTLSVGRLSSELLHFKNLTKLTVDTLDYKHVNYNLIKQFAKLDELLIWDANRTNFDKLIKQKADSKNKGLKIYFKAVDTSMDDFDFVTIDRINSGVLNENYYSTYLSLSNHLKEEFPHNILVIHSNLNTQMYYFSKFTNLNCLLLRTHRVTLNNWIKLLKAIKLNDVMISANLEQKYFDLLPKYCKKLQRLSIDNFDNLDFIFELKYLTNLTLHEFPSFEMLKRLIETLKYIKFIKIHSNESTHYAFEIDSNMITFHCKDEQVFSDSKDCFLNSTILNIQTWSDLLNIGGNAICETYMD